MRYSASLACRVCACAETLAPSRAPATKPVGKPDAGNPPSAEWHAWPCQGAAQLLCHRNMLASQFFGRVSAPSPELAADNELILVTMAGAIITRSDVAACDVMMIELRCGRCDRYGRLSVTQLLAEHGPNAEWARSCTHRWATACTRTKGRYGNRCDRSDATFSQEGGSNQGSPRRPRLPGRLHIGCGWIMAPDATEISQLPARLKPFCLDQAQRSSFSEAARSLASTMSRHSRSAVSRAA